MRASVVLEPGTVPNCRGSICLSTVGLTKRSTTVSSANLERIDVREIGRRSSRDVPCCCRLIGGSVLEFSPLFKSYE